MLNSRAIEVLTPLFQIIKNAKGKTIGQIKLELNHERENMKKGASGLIVETLLGIKNNNKADADIPEIGCEVKVLPIKKNKNGTIVAKEPSQIQTINYFQVAEEKWETAKIRKKITLTFWVVYLAQENGIKLEQNDYKIIDYFIDHPNSDKISIFQKDWEFIQDYIIRGLANKLSCSMGTYIEPKTKGPNKQGMTDAPDGVGGIIEARRRGFYYKRRYTNSQIIANIDLSLLK